MADFLTLLWKEAEIIFPSVLQQLNFKLQEIKKKNFP